MIEIAISLAIIGFALVAIIGILPAGMNVQKDNRQETIINQDASVFMNAFRNADRGLDDLTNYVMAITNTAQTYLPRGALGPKYVYSYTYQDSRVNGALEPTQHPIRTGSSIVGLLGTPKFVYRQGGGYISNHVVAFVRSMSGPASEKAPQDDPIVRGLALNYKLIPDVSTSLTNIYIPPPPPSGATTTDLINYNNYLRFVLTYTTNVHEVRLTFRWPLLPNGDTGPSRQAYRTTISGPLTNDPQGSPFFYFQPHLFIKGT